MIVQSDESTVGAISGGCLEREVAALAEKVIASSDPMLHTFEMGEDDYIRGFGTGCGGDLQILVESAPADGRLSLMQSLDRAYDHRSGTAIATIIGCKRGSDCLGRRMVISRNASMESDLPVTLVDPIQETVEQATEGETCIRSLQTETGTVEVLVEHLPPLIRLVILGDGPDVNPVVRMAAEMGWQSIVVGQKAREDLEQRFPEADNHQFLMHPDEFDSSPLDARSAVVVMTHNYLRDRALLNAILPSEAGYIGMLGPKNRSDRILKELREESASISNDQLERMYGPAGLDLGTETPEEIALSICSEIQAVMHGRSATALREREGPIHTPVVTSGR